MTDQITPIETYRGVEIHDCQPQDRIESVVKPAIDAVIAMTDPADLVRYCGDIARPPEARLLAAAKLQAGHVIAAANRAVRPPVDITYVRAAVAGLTSRAWRSPWTYGSLLDHSLPQGDAGAARRPEEYRLQVEADGERRRREERDEK